MLGQQQIEPGRKKSGCPKQQQVTIESMNSTGERVSHLEMFNKHSSITFILLVS